MHEQLHPQDLRLIFRGTDQSKEYCVRGRPTVVHERIHNASEAQACIGALIALCRIESVQKAGRGQMPAKEAKIGFGGTSGDCLLPSASTRGGLWTAQSSVCLGRSSAALLKSRVTHHVPPLSSSSKAARVFGP